MGSSSIALDIARMITEFLGPHYPRLPAGTNATLNALRTRLETGTSAYDNNRDKLAWEVREAIRTEFFKIIYPTPPTQTLLNLVTRTELLLTNFPPKARPLFFPNRPFYFPGARVAVPTEAGSRRAGTTLQLRFKEANNAVVTESLLHLDGPSGGSFQWVQTQALTPLIHYQAPMPTPIRRPVKLPVMPSRAIAPRGRQRPPAARPTARPTRTRATNRTTTRAPSAPSRRKPAAAQKQAPPASSAENAAASKPQTPASVAPTPEIKKPPPPPKPVKVEPPKPPSPPPGPAMLPPTFVPESILSTSPPPRKRLRGDSELPLSHTSGTLRRTLDITQYENPHSEQGLVASAERVKKLIGVERLVARRRVQGSGDVEYFVKWCGRSIRDGSWERRDALLTDVPGLVMEFDTKHPTEPTSVRHSDRVKTESERAIEEKNQKDSLGNQDGAHTNEEGNTEKAADVDENREAQSSQADRMDVDTSVKMDERTLEESITNYDGSTKYIDDVSGVEMPAYVDTPILELNFAGMILQIRRPNECALHNDAASAARDYKRRQARLKQENLLLAEKLFPLSKTEAKAILEASLRAHKAYNQYPMHFPRGVGQVVPSDVGVPFTKEILATAPISWESYFYSIGLRPKHFERNLPPYMPNLDSRAVQKLALAAGDLSLERAVEHRERARSLVRAAYRHSNGAAPPQALFRDGQRRAGDSAKCYGEQEAMKGKTPPPKTSTAEDTEMRERNPGIAAALSVLKQLGEDSSVDRWYDPVWSCWRVGSSPTTG